MLNEFYHRIFYYDAYDPNGILFKKERTEIDELLFIHYLYKEAKKSLNKVYKARIEQAKISLDSCDDDQIADYEKLKAICNVCAFYCMSYYYAFKSEFLTVDAKKVFMYDKFYSDKDF